MMNLFNSSIKGSNQVCDYSVHTSKQKTSLNCGLFSLIGFRALNRKDKVIVYQRITHNTNILVKYITFLKQRGENTTFLNVEQHRNQVRYLILLDETLVEPFLDNHGDPTWFYHNIVDKACNLFQKNYLNESVMVEELVSLVKCCMPICNTNKMGNILHSAFINDYADIIGEIFHKDFKKQSLCHYDSKWSSGFVNNTLLLIANNNIDKFLSQVREKGYNINSGPQALRDQTNTINCDLSLLDSDYLYWCACNEYPGGMKTFRGYSFFKRGMYPF